MSKPLSHYFVKGEALKRFYDLSATGIGFINSFLTITYLSVFHFGLFQLILAFFAILDGFNIKNLDGPIATEMRYYLKSGEKSKAKRIYREMSVWRIGFSVLVGVVVFFASDFIAKIYGDDIGLLIKIASFLPFLYSLQSLQAIFLKSIISFAYWGAPAIREIAKLAIIVFLIVTNQFTILGIVIAHVLAQALSVLVIWLIAVLWNFRKVFKEVPAYADWLIFDFLKTNGKWIFLRFGLSRITKNTMPWLVKFFINMEAVAFYSLALNLVSFVESFIPIAGISPLFLLRLGDNRQLSFIFKRSVKYVFWLGLIFMIVALLLGSWAILLVFPKYAPAIPLFRVMILALPIYGIYKILKSIISVLREYKVLAMRIFNEVIIIVIGSLILLPTIGLLGIGLIYGLTYVERVWFFYSQLIKKYPEFHLKFRRLFRFDADDGEMIKTVFRQTFSYLKSFLRRI